MGKFAVLASYDMDPANIDTLLPMLLAHRDRCLKNEPGTMQFDVLRAENRLMIYEVYQDEAAFEAHRTGASSAQFRVDAVAVKRELIITKCIVVD